MTWGKEWPKPVIDINISPNRIKDVAAIEQARMNEYFKTQPDMLAPVLTGFDMGTGERVVLTEYKDGVIKHTDITKEYKNKVPTHDPYTNPNANIYYQCNCGAVLDPGTKSFAALNNAAMNAGWKIRFGHEYYVPYCVKCGEGVE